jgi:hypothetical protein
LEPIILGNFLAFSVLLILLLCSLPDSKIAFLLYCQVAAGTSRLFRLFSLVFSLLLFLVQPRLLLWGPLFPLQRLGQVTVHCVVNRLRSNVERSLLKPGTSKRRHLRLVSRNFKMRFFVPVLLNFKVSSNE